jgi:hypothetical protein
MSQSNNDALRTDIHMKMLTKASNAKDLGNMTAVPLGYAVTIAVAEIKKAEVVARLDEVKDLYFDISTHEGRYVKGRCLQYLEQRETSLLTQASKGGEL